MRFAAGRISSRLLIAVVGTIGLLLAVAMPARATTPMAGLQAHLAWGGVDSASVNRQLDALKYENAGLARVDVGWSTLEQYGKGKYDPWYVKKLDYIVDQAEARGIKLLFTFTDSPCWASSAPDDVKQGCEGDWSGREVQRYAPNDPQDYADAFAWIVNRYGSRVAAWEIWNEPNDTYYFRSSDRAADYAAIVKRAYSAGKAASPGSTIIAGALANSDVAFMEKLYDHGIKGHYDALSIHPYNGDKSPLERLPEKYAPFSLTQGPPLFHQTMLRHDDRKPLWLTEWGWSTCTIRGQQPWQNCVDEPNQADYLREALKAMRGWDYVRATVYFNLKNWSTNTGRRADNYGLVDSNWNPKPAYDAYRDAAARYLGDPGPLDAPLGGGDDQPPDPSPSPPSTGPDTTGDRVNVTLHVRRGRRSVFLMGRGPRHGKVLVTAFRYKRHEGRYATKPSYRTQVRVNGKGRFRRRVAKRSLRHGAWRFVAAPAGHRTGRAVVSSIK